MPYSADRSPASCIDCMAWGILNGRRCAACTLWRRKHRGDEQACAGCGRSALLRNRHCRLCWNQARAEAHASGPAGGRAIASRFLNQIGSFHQLFFAGMLNSRGAATTPPRTHDRPGAPRKPPPEPARRPPIRWIQLRLLEARRDFTRFDAATDADPGNPWLRWAIYVAHQLGETHGWRRGMHDDVRRALTVVLSRHTAGDIIRYSELFPAVRALDISVERVAEVLAEMGVLIDDRRPSFRNLAGAQARRPGRRHPRRDRALATNPGSGRPPHRRAQAGHRLDSHEQRPAHPPGLVTAL
ncbi:hypothetical protein ACQEVF_49990 [Nonomuraea polychroma]|uniref:hypothetical protein n=1 Tax=Nonomuraea polychroma TaxID=46176 RepID=UPI003D9211C5